MQVSVESTSALERRMTIGVPVERIETEVNKRLQQTASRAKIPGFRPGKVPMSVIRQRYEAAGALQISTSMASSTSPPSKYSPSLKWLVSRPSRSSVCRLK